MTKKELKQIKEIIRRIAVRDRIILGTYCLETNQPLTLNKLVEKIQYSLFWEYIELPLEETEDFKRDLLYNKFLESPMEYQFKIINPIAKRYL